jgi:hypothetical protein
MAPDQTGEAKIVAQQGCDGGPYNNGVLGSTGGDVDTRVTSQSSPDLSLSLPAQGSISGG